MHPIIQAEVDEFRKFAQINDFYQRGFPMGKMEAFLSAALHRAVEKAEKEIIICSAIDMNDGYIIRGHRHNDCILTASKIPRYRDNTMILHQGFVTSKNRFVGRKEAYQIQKSAGIESKDGYRGEELFSEDLY